MKKFIVLLLSVSLLLISIAGCKKNRKSPVNDGSDSNTTSEQESVPQANPETDFEYKKNDDGGITITRYIGESLDVIIPDKIDNTPVTQIGHLAFVTDFAIAITPSNEIHSIQMPNTITLIDTGAFTKCNTLESVVLSEKLITIGAFAFQECVKLKHITIPSTVREIGDQAFEGAGLETIVFKDGLETIGGYGAFARTQIKQLVLPSTLKDTGSSTFAACLNLESVVLNEGLVKIGHKSFVSNPKLKEIVIPKTVEYVTEMDFNVCSGLEKIMFEGNAPATFEYSDPISGLWEPYNVHFTIYYHEGAQGFASPEWYGYPTQIW